MRKPRGAGDDGFTVTCIVRSAPKLAVRRKNTPIQIWRFFFLGADELSMMNMASPEGPKR